MNLFSDAEGVPPSQALSTLQDVFSTLQDVFSAGYIFTQNFSQVSRYICICNSMVWSEIWDKSYE